MDENLKSQFSRTIEENKQRILRICRAYASSFEDQQDLFQDVALNIWKSLPSFRNEAMINPGSTGFVSMYVCSMR